MKLKQLIESKEALSNLSITNLPINVSWNIKKFIKKVNPEIITFEEIKKEKFLEMGFQILDENNNPTQDWKIKPENVGNFTKVINDLFEKDVEVDIPIIKINDLLEYKDSNNRGISISSNDLSILDWLIVE